MWQWHASIEHGFPASCRSGSSVWSIPDRADLRADLQPRAFAIKKRHPEPKSPLLPPTPVDGGVQGGAVGVDSCRGVTGTGIVPARRMRTDDRFVRVVRVFLGPSAGALCRTHESCQIVQSYRPSVHRPIPLYLPCSQVARNVTIDRKIPHRRPASN